MIFWIQAAAEHMRALNPGPGIAFACESDGRILRILHDGLSLGSFFVPGALFTSRVARDQLQATLEFLWTIQRDGAAYGLPLTMELDGQERRLVLDGVKEADTLIILAAPQDSRDTTSGEDLSLEEFTRINNELSNLQRSLAKKNVELSRLNELKNEFLGMAAHDLRGSIWVIQLNCKFLQREAASLLSEDLQDCLTTISDTAESLQRTLGDYLTVSAIEAGKLTLHPRQEDLELLFRKAIQFNRALADYKHIGLELQAEPSLPRMRLDAEKILQAINNLIGNAIKFSPRGTSITLRLNQSPPDEIVFSIEDQGRGIPESDRARIFDPFDRGPKADSSRVKGTGLGLAITKKIIEAHGGRIWVESTVGKGSVFSVALPVE
jgi:signal transduction histidine kinase